VRSMPSPSVHLLGQFSVLLPGALDPHTTFKKVSRDKNQKQPQYNGMLCKRNTILLHIPSEPGAGMAQLFLWTTLLHHFVCCTVVVEVPLLPPKKFFNKQEFECETGYDILDWRIFKIVYIY
jgi:hypothetical protein